MVSSDSTLFSLTFYAILFQNYPSDSMAKVVAKKWGYAAPEEYYDLGGDKDNTDVAVPPVGNTPESDKKVTFPYLTKAHK